jgi:oxalate decarboxylase
MPQIWSSFNTVQRRIQNGGWARQVTQADFPISTTISGVNMRLTAGGIRELHWHQAAEWAYMTYGHCRVTVIDPMGRPYVADVKEGDIWYFPAGYPHSLQGLGPDGCEFVICFDDGAASEFNTLLVTDWFAHTPPAVLAENFGVPATTFAKTPLNNLWIFQGKVPGDLPAVREAMTANAKTPPQPFTFSLATSPNLNGTKNGTLQLADSSSFKVSTSIAAVLQTVPPGAMRACIGILMPTSGNTTSKAGPAWACSTPARTCSRWISILAISATSLATTGIMCRTLATPTCNSSPCSGHRIFRRSPCQTGLNILQRKWWRSI